MWNVFELLDGLSRLKKSEQKVLYLCLSWMVRIWIFADQASFVDWNALNRRHIASIGDGVFRALWWGHWENSSSTLSGNFVDICNVSCKNKIVRERLFDYQIIKRLKISERTHSLFYSVARSGRTNVSGENVLVSGKEVLLPYF